MSVHSMRQFFPILMILFSQATISETEMVRVEYLGFNETGSKLAIFQSHFGPSSKAPFAVLKILDAESGGKPLYENGKSSFSGDEEVIAQLRSDLILEAQKKFQELGIQPRVFESVDGLSTQFDNQLLVELNTRRPDFEWERFNLRFESKADNACPSGASLTAHLFRIVTGEIIALNKDRDSCFDRKWVYSRANSYGQFIWLHFFVQMEVMPDLYLLDQELVPFKK